MADDVDEEEGQDPDREHGERDPGAVAEQPEPRQRQAEIDGEAREGAQDDGFGKGHANATLA